MLIKLFQKSGLIKKIRYPVGMAIAESKFTDIKEYIRKSDRILEIGAGTGDIVELLRKDGYNKVVACDVANMSFIDDVKPVIYDGVKIPFDDNKFDVSLLVTVLHHCKDPEQVLKEASRVSKKVIIVEEAYSNSFQKYLTFIWDSIMNLEFFGHPHSNKTDGGWKSLFGRLKLKLIDSNIHRDGILLRVSYFLAK